MTNAETVIDAFRRESASLDQSLHAHPMIGALLLKKTAADAKELASAYCRWLKITEHYVRQTVPMLAAAGNALKTGDDEDRKWSHAFLHYRDEEIDPKEQYGHEIWATQGLKALGAADEVMRSQEPSSIDEYKRFFVTNAHRHPYAILGAKGVLEHLSILNAPKLEDGLRASGIPNIEHALRFIAEHGVLDIAHVQEGNERIKTITSQEKLSQILLGAYFTSGSYRAFLECV